LKEYNNLDGIFRPESVAVIGVPSKRQSLGWEILNNLILSDFNDKVFPINPNAEQIHSIKSYKSILEINGT